MVRSGPGRRSASKGLVVSVLVSLGPATMPAPLSRGPAMGRWSGGGRCPPRRGDLAGAGSGDVSLGSPHEPDSVYSSNPCCRTADDDGFDPLSAGACGGGSSAGDAGRAAMNPPTSTQVARSGNGRV